MYGTLDEVRRPFTGNAVLVRSTAGDLPAIPGVALVEGHNAARRLTLQPGVTPQDVLKALVAQNVSVEQFEIAAPTLDEIFIQVVQSSEPSTEASQ